MIGERLGDWVLDVEIAHNDMGLLFRAQAAAEPKRLAALKWMTHPKTKSPEFENSFQRKSTCFANYGIRRSWPYSTVVNSTAAAASSWNGSRGAISRFFSAAAKNLPGQRRCRSRCGSCRLLRYAHRRGVLHRDLKPSNLFRCDDGAIKLSDFGITKYLGDALPANSDNMLGSVFFISPEQAAGKPHTKRSDFYSLGCLLYALAAGRQPFTGNTVVELIHKHCFVLPERPIHFVPDLPEELDRFIMRLLAKEPAQRPGSSTLLIQELDGIWSMLERKGAVGKRPPSVAGEDDGDLAAETDALLAPRVPEPIPREPLPFLRRWYVVGPLFAACVLLLLWGFWWRKPGADDLMTKARPLLESEDPADWDKAWTEYLGPLSRRFPDKYPDEVKDARAKIAEKGDLQRAMAAGNSVRYRSEAERFYHEGLRLAQSGEWESARRKWESLVRAFDGDEASKHRVTLARYALQRTDNHASTNLRSANGVQLEEQLRQVAERIERLRTAGHAKEADALEQALLFLYRDDPEIEKIRRMLAPGKD